MFSAFTIALLPAGIAILWLGLYLTMFYRLNRLLFEFDISPQIFNKIKKNQDRKKYNADASTNWNDPKSLDYNHMQYEAWISFDFIAGFCLLSNSFHNCIIYTVRSPRFKVIVHITVLKRFKNQNFP